MAIQPVIPRKPGRGGLADFASGALGLLAAIPGPQQAVLAPAAAGAQFGLSQTDKGGPAPQSPLVSVANRDPGVQKLRVTEASEALQRTTLFSPDQKERLAKTLGFAQQKFGGA